MSRLASKYGMVRACTGMSFVQLVRIAASLSGFGNPSKEISGKGFCISVAGLSNLGSILNMLFVHFTPFGDPEASRTGK